MRIDLDPPVIVQPSDGRREVRGRRGGSANPLRRGDGEHGSRVARRAVDGGCDGRNARADVIEVVSKVVNEGSGRSFLASLDSFFESGVVIYS